MAEQITKPAQLACLASAPRQEIVDILSRMGTASIGEIADALGRPADALYYHLRALVRVGLVVTAGIRKGPRRPMALYRTPTPMLELRYDKRAASRRYVPKIVSAMMRLGTRDFARALGTDVTMRGPERELWAIRTTGWLRRSQLPTVNERIVGLRDAVSRPKGKGRLYAITIVIAPIDRSRRRRT
jgi:DNA-binding transcriptional ArsR family regulator